MKVIVLAGGCTASSLFSSHFIPTAMDMPDIEVEIADPAGPAISNAMADAIGSPDPAGREAGHVRTGSAVTAMEGAEMESSARPAEIIVNRSSVGHISGAEPLRHALDVHRRLPSYQVTPLLDCPSLAAALGVGQVWVKDESCRFGLPSFKMLGASYAAYRELCRLLGEEPPWWHLADLNAALAPLGPLTLVAATDGNHGRAVARFARMLGYSSRIYVPNGTTAARIDAIESEGASVTVITGDYDHAVRRAAEDAAGDVVVISDMSWRGYEQIPAWMIDGYSTMFWEAQDQLAAYGAAALDAVALPVGTGALAAAAVRHFRGQAGTAPARLIGVEPLDSDCVLRSVRAGRLVIIPGPQTSIMAGLNCGTPSPLAWPLIVQGLDVLVAIDDGLARDAMRMLDQAGVVAGETGAAALGGLIALRAGHQAPQVTRAAGLGPGARVLVICSEGATDKAAYQQIIGHPPSDHRSQM
jgi:diaminopropionate ammonia-lyase